MRLSEFIALYRGLAQEEFLRRVPFPLLLETTDRAKSPELRRVFVLRDSALIVGRGDDCHLPISDPQVSTRHAEILPPGSPQDPWRIVDRGSTNQTTLDDEVLEPEEPADLAPGAVLAFGPASRFAFILPDRFLRRFASELDIDLDLDEDDRTMRFQKSDLKKAKPDPEEEKSDPEDADAPEEPAPAAPAPQVEHDSAEELLLLCPPRDPMRLPVGRRVVIGRKETHADLVIDEDAASRAHAEIERRPDGVYVRDLDSTNGTLMGGTRLTSEWTPLAVLLPIEIGKTRLFVTPAKRRRKKK